MGRWMNIRTALKLRVCWHAASKVMRRRGSNLTWVAQSLPFRGAPVAINSVKATHGAGDCHRAVWPARKARLEGPGPMPCALLALN